MLTLIAFENAVTLQRFAQAKIRIKFAILQTYSLINESTLYVSKLTVHLSYKLTTLTYVVSILVLGHSQGRDTRLTRV